MVCVPNPSYGICGTYTLHLATLSWSKFAQDDADLLVWAIFLHIPQFSTASLSTTRSQELKLLLPVYPHDSTSLLKPP